MTFLHCIYYYIYIVNNHGDFIIVRWYKRGTINGKITIYAWGNSNGGNRNYAKNEQYLQLDAGGISYHILNILPSNSELLSFTTALGSELNGIEFTCHRSKIMQTDWMVFGVMLGFK